MAPKRPKPRLVRIEWLDAESKANWSDKESVQDWIATPIGTAVSVGFLLRDDAEAVVLAADDGGDDWGSMTKIPRGMVIRVDQLGKTRGRNEKEKQT